MKTKRLPATLLCLCMAAMLLPAAALAAPGARGQLTVNGVPLVSGGQATNSGTPGASYDYASNTLTLSSYDGGQIWAMDMGDDFTIYLAQGSVNKAAASGAGSDEDSAIWMENGSLAISGSGSLTAETQGTGGSGVAVRGGDLTISGSATVSAAGPWSGIYSGGSITISGSATVSAAVSAAGSQGNIISD
ncbi:MAG: hypothetical protein Q4B48_08860, partial [Syntrophomonadaceae bacterium]|nr:hypothetical protein [Syntrophomonadaceae bacterium]